MEINKRENIGWIDLLRVTACFLVVFAHCCDPFVARFDTDRPTFLQGCALGSAVRCCVPLFVMMTGVLLFPVRNGMSEFYKKRIGRIVVPLIFTTISPFGRRWKSGRITATRPFRCSTGRENMWAP